MFHYVLLFYACFHLYGILLDMLSLIWFFIFVSTACEAKKVVSFVNQSLISSTSGLFLIEVHPRNRLSTNILDNLVRSIRVTGYHCGLAHALEKGFVLQP